MKCKLLFFLLSTSLNADFIAGNNWPTEVYPRDLLQNPILFAQDASRTTTINNHLLQNLSDNYLTAVTTDATVGTKLALQNCILSLDNTYSFSYGSL